MQSNLRHDVVRTLFHAEPVREEALDRPTETELTRAARGSVANADKIIEAEEFHEEDFTGMPQQKATKKKQTADGRKKARKAERQRRAKGKKRKH